MKVLVTAATEPEIKPLINWLKEEVTINGQIEVEVMITGIGMFSTAYHLGKYFAKKRPDLAIQAGIAGSFQHSWPIGETVVIEQEVLGDLGVEDNDQYKDLFDIGLWKADMAPFTHNYLPNTSPDFGLRKARGVTVNMVSGSAATITRLEEKYQPDIESMEGAAFHYCCLMENIPFLQLRTISNYVEVRDKSKWNIPLAVTNLNNTLRSILQTIK
ncbi:futalosine hydrolase [Chitinophaga sp. SYP-B3965]|uniref:futalosine hydrolase n=1 Tax=Chitinophaga sp. SYP-B3965 TaxID=2663120 RepID=UPI00156647B4|nr:futalosine hydrolase [Chitinophaga sp. SYP-B3965]